MDLGRFAEIEDALRGDPAFMRRVRRMIRLSWCRAVSDRLLYGLAVLGADMTGTCWIQYSMRTVKL